MNIPVVVATMNAIRSATSNTKRKRRFFGLLKPKEKQEALLNDYYTGALRCGNCETNFGVRFKKGIAWYSPNDVACPKCGVVGRYEKNYQSGSFWDFDSNIHLDGRVKPVKKDCKHGR